MQSIAKWLITTALSILHLRTLPTGPRYSIWAPREGKEPEQLLKFFSSWILRGPQKLLKFFILEFYGDLKSFLTLFPAFPRFARSFECQGFSQLFSEQISERLFVYPEDECIERPSLSASEEIFIFLQRNIWRPWKYCVLSSLLESMIQFNHEAVDEWEKLVNNWNSIMRSNFVCRAVKYIEKGGNHTCC